MKLLEQALNLVIKIEQGGAYGNIELNNFLKKQKKTDEKKLLTEMVYGTVRAGGTLDWLISFYINRKKEKIAPKILSILRICVYQIFFMQSVKPALLCSDAVELAKRYGHIGSSKFVNAVLRAMVKDPDKPKYPNRKENLVKYLSLRYFYPEWIVEKWLVRFGEEIAERLCTLCNQPPKLTLRANLLKNTRDELIEKIVKGGFEVKKGKWSKVAIICENANVGDIKAFLENGDCYIQDEAAMLAVELLEPKEGEIIFDLCAAPGGKATYIAEIMNNTGSVMACDIYEHKLKLIKENAEKLGVLNLQPKLLDATKIEKNYYEKADAVLIDAPCSGLGVLRRRADLRWRKSAKDSLSLTTIQKNIINNAAKCLKKGGRLLYSTCTMEQAENEHLIAWFLENNADFSLCKPMINMFPHIHGTDGFFMALLCKNS